MRDNDLKRKQMPFQIELDSCRKQNNASNNPLVGSDPESVCDYCL